MHDNEGNHLVPLPPVSALFLMCHHKKIEVMTGRDDYGARYAE
jgi:hypothetical protein